MEGLTRSRAIEALILISSNLFPPTEKCCKCDANGAKAALKSAPRFEEVHGDAELEPSFMEVVANFQHAVQNGVEECCPCRK